MFNLVILIQKTPETSLWRRFHIIFDVLRYNSLFSKESLKLTIYDTFQFLTNLF